MKSITLIIGLLSFVGLNAQDIHFTNSMASPKAIINPSTVGALGGEYSVGANYRTQWKSIENPYVTYGFFASGNLHTSKGHYFSLGLDFLGDKAGVVSLKQQQVRLNLSGHILIGDKSTFGVGLQGGYLQNSFDVSKAQWDEQYSNGAYNSAIPVSESLTPVSKGLDISTGIHFKQESNRFNYFNNEGWYFIVGIAGYHLNKPKREFLSTEKLARKININAEGYVGFANTLNGIAYNVLLSFQGPQQEYVFGAYYRYLIKQASKMTKAVDGMAIGFGANYRWNDALSPCINFELGQFSVYTCYDLNISKLTAFSHARGGFEFGLKFSNSVSFNGVKGFR